MPPVSISSKATPVPLGRQPLAVAGHPRLGRGHRLGAADQAVDQGALADVGEADDGDQRAHRRAHARPRARFGQSRGDDPADDLFQAHRRCVELDRVLGGAQGAVLALGVAGVAAALGVEHRFEVLAGLRRAAARPLLVGGGEEDLERRLGADHGADVAPLGDVVGGGDQLALALDHRLAHAGVDGDPGGGGGHLRVADRGADVAPAEQHPAAVEVDLEPGGQFVQRRAVVEVGAGLERGQRHAAVHRPGVEVGEAELGGDRASDGGLAGPGGTVDGDDHQLRVWMRKLRTIPAAAQPPPSSEPRSPSKPG